VSQPDSLDAWLALLETRHPSAIQLGLERVAQVRAAMGLDPDFPIITVGGTNGKGSTCAYLEAILADAGYRVGCYTSPHLLRYPERVRVGGLELTDAEHIAAFAAVEAGRGGIPLTYFEHGTLAAMWLFRRARIEAAVLEVGLGGRLDAVNVFDADCAIVTSVDLDHQEYLGDTRAAIGYEKAGIFRAGRPAVVTDPDPPATLLAHAQAIGARLLCLGREIRVEAGEGAWTCRVGDRVHAALPRPVLPGEFQLHNAAAAVAALSVVRERLPVSALAMRAGIARARPSGRFQVLPGPPRVILDVAHNPHAARALAGNLAARPGPGRCLAVLGMLRDKDAAGVARALAGQVDAWFAAGLDGPRGLAGDALAERMRQAGLGEVRAWPDVAGALQAACAEAGPADIIVVLGSFHTVAEALKVLSGAGTA
jgi:dihydrofolate synthase/folylpolyglutamate synthase